MNFSSKMNMSRATKKPQRVGEVKIKDQGAATLPSQPSLKQEDECEATEQDICFSGDRYHQLQYKIV